MLTQWGICGSSRVLAEVLGVVVVAHVQRHGLVPEQFPPKLQQTSHLPPPSVSVIRSLVRRSTVPVISTCWLLSSRSCRSMSRTRASFASDLILPPLVCLNARQHVLASWFPTWIAVWVLPVYCFVLWCLEVLDVLGEVAESLLQPSLVLVSGPELMVPLQVCHLWLPTVKDLHVNYNTQSKRATRRSDSSQHIQWVHRPKHVAVRSRQSDPEGID